MFGTLSLPPRDGRSTQSLSLGVRRDVGHSDGEVERPFMAGPGPMLDECGDRHKSTVAGSCRPISVSGFPRKRPFPRAFLLALVNLYAVVAVVGI